MNTNTNKLRIRCSHYQPAEAFTSLNIKPSMVQIVGIHVPLHWSTVLNFATCGDVAVIWKDVAKAVRSAITLPSCGGVA